MRLTCGRTWSGGTIVRCELLFPTIVRHPEPEVFIDTVVGQRITSVGRRGKYILIRLAGDLVLVVHLGMSGQLRIVGPANATREPHARGVRPR